MSIRKQLAQLKKLSDINPDEQWAHATKYAIMSEVTVQSRAIKSQGQSFRERFALFFANFFAQVVPSMTKVVAVVLVLSVGSGFSLVAQASVPGDAMWPLKRNLEEAELALTLSPVKKTEIHIKHINNRLDEIDKILKEKTEDSTTEENIKTEIAIKKAVSHLEKDVVAVDNSLKIVKEEKTAMQVVSLVEKVAIVANETAANLNQKVSTVQNTEIAKVLDDAKKVNQDVKDSAVNLAVTVHEQVVNNIAKEATATGSVATPTATVLAQNVVNASELKAVTEVVTKIISSELQVLSQEIAEAKDKVASVDKKDINNLPKSSNIKIGEADAKAIASIDTLKARPEIMEANLTQAKDLLSQGNLKDSLEKITEVKETYKQAETVIKRIEEASTTSGINSASTTPTSTKPTLPSTTTPTSTKPSTGTVIKSSDETTTPESISEPVIKEDEGIPEEVAVKDFY